jgi:TPR repeat protein
MQYLVINGILRTPRLWLALMFVMLITGLVACGMVNELGMGPPPMEAEPAKATDKQVANEIMEYNSGLMYYKGRGVEQSYSEAANWFRLSAQKGYAPALYSLGHMFSRGNGVPQSMAQAFKHFSLAAEQGYAPAQFAVGYMYAKGQSVKQDKLLAHMWLNLAAARGVKDAATLRDQMAKMMTQEEINKAQQMAVEWSPSPPIGLPMENQG